MGHRRYVDNLQLYIFLGTTDAVKNSSQMMLSDIIDFQLSYLFLCLFLLIHRFVDFRIQLLVIAWMDVHCFLISGTVA